MKKEDNDQHENLCELEKTAEISSKLRCYKLPDGTQLNMGNDHFNEMVDLFRILRKWRDECNKT